MPSQPSALSIRKMLKSGGSPARAQGMQRFFKKEIKAHGWRTADVRRAAALTRRTLKENPQALLKLADQLFSSSVLEEKIFAVFLLEKGVAEFGDGEFRLFESWLKRINTWADHDTLVYGLIGPMLPGHPRRIVRVFSWAKSRDRWHRRASAVALIRGTRKKIFAVEIRLLSEFLLQDDDLMVQKGLGWLLREWTKCDPKIAIPFLMKIRDRSPRLVLRTACETLPKYQRKLVLGV
jgi:3-methyladenine DNA glycosylase AlkD